MLDVQIKSTPLDVAECYQKVQHDSAGGIALFVGTVRNATKGKTVVQLDFEAYEPMAISELRKIGQYAKTHWQVEKMCMHHRVGTLAIGEIAVVIAVATPHRKAAFEACEYAIDTLKETVPILEKRNF